MHDKVVSFIPPVPDHDISAPPHRLRLKTVLLLLLPLFLAQIAVYYRSFGVKPASDDFPIVYEIIRGNAHGPGVFFRESMSNMHHRPFKSLSIWAFGQLSDQHRAACIRILHFIGMAAYATVLALWLWRLNLSPIGCAVAMSVMLFHPTLPQALASVDGIDGISSSALIWLGAWTILTWQNKIWRLLVANVICFVLAAGWKEYSFAIVPLAIWTMLCFGGKDRLRKAGILFIGLCAVFAVIMVVRQRAIPPGYNAGLNYASLNPLQWIQNGAIMGSGLLFFGNSIWVFVHQSPAVLGLVGVCILISFAMIARGVIWEVRRQDVATEIATPLRSRARWTIFLLGAFIAASFPVNVIFHMSEMYLAPLLLPLALLCGLAAEGWQRRSPPARLVASAIAVAALVSSVVTIVIKVDGLRDVGQRAEDQMIEVLSLLPPGAQNLKVGILFNLDELPPKRTYAVYRMGDEVLVVHSMALDYFAPGRHLVLGSYPMGSPDFHPEQFDVIFKWNHATQHFERTSL